MTSKKILVTGCAGFVGFHLVKKILLKKNYQIIGVDNINNYYDINLKKSRLKILKKISHNKKNFEFVKLDISNKVGLEKIFKKNYFFKVVHLAAQAGVRYSLKNPDIYADTNLTGFFNVLDCCRKFKIKHFLYASSSSVYGATKRIPFIEDNVALKPIQFYAATKVCNEVMAYTYSSLYNIKTTGLRFFTVYGPWGRPDMAFFSFTKKILENKIINVFNYGKHLRDFTYIDDIVSGIEKVLFNKPKANIKNNFNIFNLGRGKPISLMRFIKILEEKIGRKAKIKFVKKQAGDMEKTYSSIKKIKKFYGYNPIFTPNEGLKLFVEWYLNYYKIKQIKQIKLVK